MENVKRLLLLTNSVTNYRIAVYNALSEFYEVTVAHYGKALDMEGMNFSQIVLHAFKIGPFTCFKENIFKIAQHYDAVLALNELRILPYQALSFIKRNFSLTYWSIGVTVSYSKKYDADKKYDWLRTYLNGRADSLVFYSNYPIKKHIKYGVKHEKLFVANNTVGVDEKIDVLPLKDYFLFVGTLYKAKKIFELLESYYQALMRNSDMPNLIVVGDGEEKENIKTWISERNLSENIILRGAIFDSIELKEIFRKAIACISPGQAGLSVLNSMAYAVPFVTTEDAISGGEIFNIKHGVNGLYYDGTIKGLTELLIHLSEHPDEVYTLSKNAQEYYFKNRTIDIMVSGFSQAIDYAFRKKNKN